MSEYSDPGIPTLTQRAEPTLQADPLSGTTFASPEPELPVLTQVAEAPGAGPTSVAAGGPGTPQPVWSTASAGDAVLRSALQAELEQAIQHAVDEAAASLRARLEAELPDLIERAVRAVRPG